MNKLIEIDVILSEIRQKYLNRIVLKQTNSLRNWTSYEIKLEQTWSIVTKVTYKYAAFYKLNSVLAALELPYSINIRSKSVASKTHC